MEEFARLPQPPEHAEIDPGEREDYDLVVERTNRVHGGGGIASTYFGALLHSPPLAATLTRFGGLVRQGQLRGSYSDADRELIDIVLGVDLRSNAILAVHIPDALAVGVRLEAIEALVGGDLGALLPEERELVDYARAVDAGTVTDETYDRLRTRFGDRGAVEFTLLVGFLVMTIRLWNAFGVPEPSDEDIADLLAAAREGRIELPDPSARIG